LGKYVGDRADKMMTISIQFIGSIFLKRITETCYFAYISIGLILLGSCIVTDHTELDSDWFEERALILEKLQNNLFIINQNAIKS
jgi:hypothetical protein